MGKGRIVSGGEDGLYTVELLHNRERIERELEFLAARLTEMQTELDALNAEREVLVDERYWIATDIDAAVANAEEGEIPDVEALLVKLAQVSAQIQAQDVRIGMLKGRMLEATKRQQQLQAIPADPQQQAWCADFTEDLTGEVATVEVPAEGIVGQFATWRRVQIRPGYEGRANYLPARDGQMHHRIGQVGYQAYFNAAILPGVQRWRPQYRIGTITSIDTEADTCSLTIQGEDSSAQSLIIDPPDLQYTKTGVPIEYMDCNALAFETGDRVLIEFQGRDWSQPKVIGFESEPRECTNGTILCTFGGLSYLLKYQEAWTVLQTSEFDGNLGFDGYWRSEDGEVVTWGSSRVYWRGLTVFRGGILGACLINGETLRAVWLEASITGGDLIVGDRDPTLGMFVATDTLTLTNREANALPGAIQFDLSGHIDIHAIGSDGVTLPDQYRLEFDGTTLTKTAIAADVYSVTGGGSVTTEFVEGACDGTPFETGAVIGGSYTQATNASGSATFNGLVWSWQRTQSISQSYPATSYSITGQTTVVCASIGLSSTIVDTDENSLTRRITMHIDRNTGRAAMMEVRTIVWSDPGDQHALEIAVPVIARPSTQTAYRVTSFYPITDATVGAPAKTTKVSGSTGDFNERGTYLSAAGCSPLPCTPPCIVTTALNAPSSGDFEWYEYLHFESMIIPTEPGGRFLLTHPNLPGSSVLEDGDIEALVGTADDYTPVSVVRAKKD